MTAKETETWVQYGLIAAGLYLAYKVLTDVENVGTGIGTGINSIEDSIGAGIQNVENLFT